MLEVVVVRGGALCFGIHFFWDTFFLELILGPGRVGRCWFGHPESERLGLGLGLFAFCLLSSGHLEGRCSMRGRLLGVTG